MPDLSCAKRRGGLPMWKRTARRRSQGHRVCERGSSERTAWGCGIDTDRARPCSLWFRYGLLGICAVRLFGPGPQSSVRKARQHGYDVARPGDIRQKLRLFSGGYLWQQAAPLPDMLGLR